MLEEISMPEGITAIYIYGSILKGKLRSDSDIDIAMLPSYGINNLEKLQLISKIESIFTSFFKSMGHNREVSVLDMRGRYVSLQLLYKIITEGMPVYEKDVLQRLEFENAIKREYFDFKPYLMHLRERKYGDLLQKA